MSRKIIDYRCVLKSDEDNFIDAVNEMIEEGYQPFGSVCIAVDENNIFYSQAMVR